MEKVSDGIYAIALLESITAAYPSPGLSEYIHDIKRFVLYNRLGIERAPLQIYCSALVFSPQNSIIRQRFQQDTPKWIRKKSKVQETWTEQLLTFEGHEYEIKDVAFSPDGKQLASVSDDETIMLWDTSTGAALQILQGHSGCINSVAFSPDGEKLASASGDKTIRLWDLINEKVQYTLRGHLREVKDIAFSPDGKLLASASADKTIRLWDIIHGKAQYTLRGHSDEVKDVTFSPDGKLLASASDDNTIKLWDADLGVALQTFKEDWYWFNAIAFSPDGKLLALVSDGGTIKLWDTGSEATLQMLEVDVDIQEVSFSRDMTFLETNGGLLYNILLSTNATPSRQNTPRTIFVKEEWIVLGVENMLWLPFDYRPSCIAVRGNIAALGHASGGVSILEFNVERLTSEAS